MTSICVLVDTDSMGVKKGQIQGVGEMVSVASYSYKAGTVDFRQGGEI